MSRRPARRARRGRPQALRVPPRSVRTWSADPVKQSHGWYDVTVTADRDPKWSQRLVGHLETGKPSISG
nr:hypothetical protein [Actinoplanes subtropicus]